MTRSYYVNPVYDSSAADPFVLKYRNEYWCYCTGILKDGRCFAILHSRDLVTWSEIGGALEPIDRDSTCYWAPEVFYDNGSFLMYYGVGNEERMQIRVATASHPAGLFVDSGVRLTAEEFAIDPHVFEDDDGARYLFYATDFLTHERVGTGTVCDRMVDAFRLEGNPRPVTRARYDWQIFDPHRTEKGGVRWHTVEGPYVLKHKGKYYEMFSGGNWTDESYGASYAMSDRLMGSEEWEQSADGRRVFPILRTVAGVVDGPGHNSVIRGPDNLQQFCVYHRRGPNRQDRVLAIDRLEWAGERMLVVGPTTGMERAPIQATVSDFFEGSEAAGLGSNWDVLSGRWTAFEQSAIQHESHGLAEARFRTLASCFIVEVSLRVMETSKGSGGVGVRLFGQNDVVFSLELIPDSNKALVKMQPSYQSDSQTIREFNLPAQFEARADHLMRLEVDGVRIRATLGGSTFQWDGEIKSGPYSLRLFTRDAVGAFAGFAFTVGWEDLFTEANVSPTALGWLSEDAKRTWFVRDQQLTCRPTGGVETVLTKGPLLNSYEFVVTARLDDESAEGYFGFMPAVQDRDAGPTVRVMRGEWGWELKCVLTTHLIALRLAEDFDPRIYQQFRFRKEFGVVTIQHESLTIGEFVAPAGKTRVGLCVGGVAASFDGVRVTAIEA